MDSFLSAARARAIDAAPQEHPGIKITVAASPPPGAGQMLPARTLARLARSLAFSSLIEHFDRCAVRPAGSAMVTNKAVGINEPLLAVPLKNCWTVAAAKACAPLAALGDGPLESIAPESLLAFHMLIVKAQRERDAEPTPRSNHIELLSATPVETLWDWSASELGLLQGSKWALAPAWSKQSAVDELDEYSHYPPLKAMLDAHGIDEATFLWARQAVAVRMMRFEAADASEPALLVVAPGVDLLTTPGGSGGNASGVGGVGVFAVEASSLVVRAPHAYAEGDEVSLCCGDGLSNGRRLLSGGASVVHANASDSVELAFTLPLHPAAMQVYSLLQDGLEGAIPSAVRGNPFAHGELDLMPTEFLDSAGEGANEVMLHVRLGGGSGASEQLARIIQFFQADILGRAVAQQGESGALTLESLTTPGTEQLAVTKLRDALANMLAAYGAAAVTADGAATADAGGSSLARDEAALGALEAAAADSPSAESTVVRRRRLALHVLVGEKRILQHALDVLRDWFEDPI